MSPTGAQLDTRGVAEAVPDSEFHVIEGGSHFPNRSHRGEVQPLLTRFIDRVLFPDRSG